MISYPVYKLVHLLGVFMVILSFGGMILGRLMNPSGPYPWKKPVAITHGVGLFLALLGGFGLLARLGIHWPWPGWIIGKLIIWLLLGAGIAVVNRIPAGRKAFWWAVLLLALLAAYLANFKPF